ncbi:mannosyl-3-phosphoglycerate synthase [Boeremia exigua]|uniref:mannosyl-3-phosphoglycerate synthase n=1 Tax=Boeremia exigua TaxID=749465 RepID=UPI001E8D4B33|nr:mannosyl-3-phosphoglycerate synthase [Boeremia exigua]KAH6621707.1 mannosyl-3-phosphoglycerate synthase [Boeremia exigua]
MRLNFTDNMSQVGNIEVDAVSKVIALDSGLIAGPNQYDTLKDGTLTAAFSQSSLEAVEKQLAIIVPCMNEEHSILEGVLHGIPHHCLIILVSNSSAENFKAECAMLNDFCTDTYRQGIAVHQQDSGLASAFAKAGMPHITTAKADTDLQNSTGIRIRNGKGEAMMIGTALAKLAKKSFVGFIDADNFVPGAVHEYCKVFAAGLSHALQHTSSASVPKQELLAMVRLKWKSKPKIVDGKLVAQESGRCSRVVNSWMNHLLASITGDHDNIDLIKTANAGEHAMSIELALQLQFANGYAVEPFQLVDAWERSGVLPPTPPGSPPPFSDADWKRDEFTLLEKKVRILQIETLNPHIHDFGKGEEHILKMQAQGLSTIYHSKLMPQGLKNKLADFMSDELMAVVGEAGVPQKACVYPSMERMDFEVLGKTITERAETIQFVGDA